MATYKNNNVKAEAVRRVRVETTYEYTPILGEILGVWKKVNIDKFGETIELHIMSNLSIYDRLTINGVEIDVSDKIERILNK